jgi:hypothetical protein
MLRTTSPLTLIADIPGDMGCSGPRADAVRRLALDETVARRHGCLDSYSQVAVADQP